MALTNDELLAVLLDNDTYIVGWSVTPFAVEDIFPWHGSRYPLRIIAESSREEFNRQQKLLNSIRHERTDFVDPPACKLYYYRVVVAD